MFDLFTYFIYLSLLFFVLLITYIASVRKKNRQNETDLTKTPKLSIYHVIALLAISIVVGFRKEVGVDWEGYKIYFDTINYYVPGYVEIGYFLINKWIANLGGRSEIMFFFIALISWYFVFRSVPNLLLPLTLYFLFVNEMFFWSMNGVRQFVALSIFLYSIPFIINRNLVKYLIFISIAVLFHSSAAIVFPLYFVPFQKLYNQKFWFIAFIISAFFSNVAFIVDGLERIIFETANTVNLLSKYLGFFDRGQFVAQELKIGYGFAFRFLVDLFIIYYSLEVVKRFPATKIYFVLFFASAVVFNLFYMYQPISRINAYFSITRSIILALITYNLWTFKRDRIISITLVLLYFILFLTTIYNSSNLCSPYDYDF